MKSYYFVHKTAIKSGLFLQKLIVTAKNLKNAKDCFTYSFPSLNVNDYKCFKF